MEKFELSELLNGRPENIEDDKEKNCYDILDNLDIKYQRVEYNFFPTDIDDLKLIDKTLQVPGIKNLIFKTKNKEDFYFIIIPREERFDEKTFRNKYKIPKINPLKIHETLNQLVYGINSIPDVPEYYSKREENK